MFVFNKAKRQVMDSATRQIVELEAKKKGLEMDIEQVRLKLDNEREGQRMELERVKHSFKLEMDGAKKDLERAKQLFEEDKKRLVSQQQDLHTAEIEKLRKEAEINLMELQSLSKLHSEQKVAEATLAKDKAVQALETKYAKDLAALEGKLAKEYYEKMQAALTELHTHGSTQSKFVQELALKMFDKGMEKPMPSHFITESRGERD